MAEPVLQARGLTKSFGAVTASRGVSLELRPGEIHAVIGPNGAGKSTLIGQLCGAIRPDAGTVLLAGRDVTAEDAPARARLGLARTFQVSQLMRGARVIDNVLLGALTRRRPGLLRRADRDPRLLGPARAALARVGLDDPHRPVAALSHGETRRLELAVALAAGPRAFVMDEPMAGLGADGTARMTALLDGLRHEAPILLVEHDMDAVFALSDRITVLVDGAVLASGPPGAIRTDPAVRAAYLGEGA